MFKSCLVDARLLQGSNAACALFPNEQKDPKSVPGAYVYIPLTDILLGIHLDVHLFLSGKRSGSYPNVYFKDILFTILYH